MHSTANQLKVPDYYAPSAIRGDMMKLQQIIHRVHTQFDQISQSLPPNLPNDIATLTNQMQTLSSKVDVETNFDYSSKISILENKINKLEKAFNEHAYTTQTPPKQNDFNDNSLLNLEQQITVSNNLFLEQLRGKIEQRIKSVTAQQNNSVDQKTVDFTLSAKFPEGSREKNANRQENQIIQIETTSVLDPGVHFRVQRHSERIKFIEDELDNLLAQKVKSYPFKKQFEKISSTSTNNRKKIDNLDKKYSDLESSLRDIKQAKKEKLERKQKLKDEQNIPGAVKHPELAEFANKILTRFNEISTEISHAESEVDQSILNFQQHLNAIDLKINNFKQTASDFESLIKLTDKRISEVEMKTQARNEAKNLSNESKNRLEILARNGEMQIQQLSEEINSRIRELKIEVDALQNERKMGRTSNELDQTRSKMYAKFSSDSDVNDDNGININDNNDDNGINVDDIY